MEEGACLESSEADGRLDECVQHDRPAADRASNALPSPASGTIGITRRVYLPRVEALMGGGARRAPPARLNLSRGCEVDEE